LAVALVASLCIAGGLTGCKENNGSGSSDAGSPRSGAQELRIPEAALQFSKVGDSAKPLSVAHWVKGASAESPIDITDGKNVYVVEFWATWCGPCKTSIPHLTELQKKHKDQGLVIIGISNETLEEVKPFVEEQGDKMDYIVAVDQDNQTSISYMEAFGQNGIPCAFIIDKAGQVVWVGHPMKMDQPLEEILTGKYDLQTNIKAAEFAQLVAAEDPAAKEMADTILKQIGTRIDLLETILEAAYQTDEWELLDKVLDQMATVDEEYAQRTKEIRSQIKTEKALEEYANAIWADEPPDAAALQAASDKLIQSLKGDVAALEGAAAQLLVGLGSQDTNIVESLLKEMASIDEAAAKKADQMRKQIRASQAMEKYKTVVDGDDPEARKEIEKEIFEALKEGDPFIMAQAAYSIVMDLGDEATAELPLQLLDEADRTQTEKPKIPNDFFRAIVYYKTGQPELGDQSAEKALAALEDEVMRTQMQAYLNSLKPALPEAPEAEPAPEPEPAAE
jgi:thiol-disulfide isomerase/thioredoxin